MATSESAPRAFAVDVVRKLRAAGYQALWAGGCVRDQLLGREPKDYDVATDARPEQIRDVFGKKRTLPFGAAFGVITVLGPRAAGQVEVATFRRDAEYSDGRHPDGVTFSTPEEDAQRRDFTINGLFFDPLAERIIDFVGGEADLKRRRLRAIGAPADRIAEDKLRMLRAVLFAAVLGFDLDPETLAAVREHAAEIEVVSAERIGAEMRKILGPRAADGIGHLNDAGLLDIVLPEARYLLPVDAAAWSRALARLQALGGPFEASLAVLLIDADSPREQLTSIGKRWRLSNQEVDHAAWLLRGAPIVLDAPRQPWPRLQRTLAEREPGPLLAAAEALLAGSGETAAAIEFCQDKIQPPRERWDPPPLVTGDDLKQAGLTPGPRFRELLERVRDEQLDGRISDRESALQFAISIAKD